MLTLNLPDYSARRRLIFGGKVLSNMALVAREEERPRAAPFSAYLRA